MKHIPLFENFADDIDKNKLSNKEIRDLVNDVPKIDTTKPFKMKSGLHRMKKDNLEDFYNISDNAVSKLYGFKQELRSKFPFIKKCKQTEYNETKNSFNIKYAYTGSNDIGEFSIDYDISLYSNNKYKCIVNNHIVRSEKIDLNDISFRVLNQDAIDFIENNENDIPNKEDVLEYLYDIKNGRKIQSYDDNMIVHEFNIFKNYNDKQQMFDDMTNSLELFNNYIKAVYNFDISK